MAETPVYLTFNLRFRRSLAPDNDLQVWLALHAFVELRHLPAYAENMGRDDVDAFEFGLIAERRNQQKPNFYYLPDSLISVPIPGNVSISTRWTAGSSLVGTTRTFNRRGSFVMRADAREGFLRLNPRSVTDDGPVRTQPGLGQRTLDKLWNVSFFASLAANLRTNCAEACQKPLKDSPKAEIPEALADLAQTTDFVFSGGTRVLFFRSMLDGEDLENEKNGLLLTHRLLDFDQLKDRLAGLKVDSNRELLSEDQILVTGTQSVLGQTHLVCGADGLMFQNVNGLEINIGGRSVKMGAVGLRSEEEARNPESPNVKLRNYFASFFGRLGQSSLEREKWRKQWRMRVTKLDKETLPLQVRVQRSPTWQSLERVAALDSLGFLYLHQDADKERTGGDRGFLERAEVVVGERLPPGEVNNAKPSAGVADGGEAQKPPDKLELLPCKAIWGRLIALTPEPEGGTGPVLLAFVPDRRENWAELSNAFKSDAASKSRPRFIQRAKDSQGLQDIEREWSETADLRQVAGLFSLRLALRRVGVEASYPVPVYVGNQRHQGAAVLVFGFGRERVLAREGSPRPDGTLADLQATWSAPKVKGTSDRGPRDIPTKANEPMIDGFVLRGPDQKDFASIAQLGVLVNDGFSYDLSPGSDGLHRQMTTVLPNVDGHGWDENLNKSGPVMEVLVEDLLGFTALQVFSKTEQDSNWRLITGGETSQLLPFRKTDTVVQSLGHVSLEFHVALRTSFTTAWETRGESATSWTAVQRYVQNSKGRQTFRLQAMHPDGTILAFDDAPIPGKDPGRVFRTFIDDPVNLVTAVGPVRRRPVAAPRPNGVGAESRIGPSFVSIKYVSQGSAPGGSAEVIISFDSLLLRPAFARSGESASDTQTLEAAQYELAWRALAELRYAAYAGKLHLAAVSFSYDFTAAFSTSGARDLYKTLRPVALPASIQAQTASALREEELREHLTSVFADRFFEPKDLSRYVEVLDVTARFRELFEERLPSSRLEDLLSSEAWEPSTSSDWSLKVPWRSAGEAALHETANLVEFRLVVSRAALLAPELEQKPPRWVSSALLQEDVNAIGVADAQDKLKAAANREHFVRFLRNCRIGSGPLPEQREELGGAKVYIPASATAPAREWEINLKERIAHDPRGRFSSTFAPAGRIRTSKDSLRTEVTTFGFLPVAPRAELEKNVVEVIEAWLEELTNVLELRDLEKHLMTVDLAKTLSRVDALDAVLREDLAQSVEQLLRQQPTEARRPVGLNGLTDAELKAHVRGLFTRDPIGTWRAKAFLFHHFPDARRRHDLFATRIEVQGALRTRTASAVTAARPQIALDQAASQPPSHLTYEVVNFLGEPSGKTLFGACTPLDDQLVSNELWVNKPQLIGFESVLEKDWKNTIENEMFVAGGDFAIPQDRYALRLASRSPLTHPIRLFMGQIKSTLGRIPGTVRLKTIWKEEFDALVKARGGDLFKLLYGPDATGSARVELRASNPQSPAALSEHFSEINLAAFFRIEADEEGAFGNDDFALHIRSASRVPAVLRQENHRPSGEVTTAAVKSLAVSRKPAERWTQLLEVRDAVTLASLIQPNPAAAVGAATLKDTFQIDFRDGRFSIRGAGSTQLHLFEILSGDQRDDSLRGPKRFALACILPRSRWHAWSIELAQQRNEYFDSAFVGRQISDTPEAAFREVDFEPGSKLVPMNRRPMTAMEFLVRLLGPRQATSSGVGLEDGNTIGVTVRGLYVRKRLSYSLVDPVAKGTVLPKPPTQFPLRVWRLSEGDMATSSPVVWLPGNYTQYEVQLSWYDASNGEFYRTRRTIEIRDR